MLQFFYQNIQNSNRKHSDKIKSLLCYKNSTTHLSVGTLASKASYTVTSPFIGTEWFLSSSNRSALNTAWLSRPISASPLKPGRSSQEQQHCMTIAFKDRDAQIHTAHATIKNTMSCAKHQPTQFLHSKYSKTNPHDLHMAQQQMVLCCKNCCIKIKHIIVLSHKMLYLSHILLQLKIKSPCT